MILQDQFYKYLIWLCRAQKKMGGHWRDDIQVLLEYCCKKQNKTKKGAGLCTVFIVGDLNYVEKLLNWFKVCWSTKSFVFVHVLIIL